MKTKQKTYFFTLLLVSVLCCMGWMTGCSVTTSTADTSSSTDSGTSDTEETEDVIGEVTYIGSSYISVSVYTSASDIDDYTAVDTADLIEDDSTDYIYASDDTEYYVVESGTLVSATAEDITEGAMIAETTSDDGVQQIILLAAEAAEETIDADVAEVTAIDGDVLSLTLYTLADDAEDYEITDAADVELDNYEASSDTDEYTIGSTDVIRVSEDGLATTADSSDIVVGDTLVIYTDSDTGYTTIVVYHT